MTIDRPKSASLGVKATIVVVCLMLVFAGLFAWLSKPATPPGLVTLNVLGEDAATIQSIESLKGNYEKENNVKINCVKNKLDVMGQKANQDLAQGTGLYDIILNYSSSLASYVRNDWVLTLHDIKPLVPDSAKQPFESDIFPNVWKEVGYYRKGTDPGANVEPIGYPFAANTMVLVYNRKMFENPNYKKAYTAKYHQELSPPKDWIQFRQIAEFFTQPSQQTYGLVLEGGSGGWLYYEWCNFAYSMGGGVMKKSYGWEGDDNTPLLIESPATIAATRYYLSLKPFITGDFYSTGADEQREHMLKQNVAMTIMWSDVLFQLVNAEGGEKFGFAPIPGSKSMISGGLFYISRKSKHKREAAAYVFHLMQKDTQAKLMRKGLCSPLRSAYEDAEVRKLPYVHALKHSLDRGTYMLEAGPDADAIMETVTTYIQRIWKGEMSVEKGLNAAAVEIKAKRGEIFGSQK